MKYSIPKKKLFLNKNFYKKLNSAPAIFIVLTSLTFAYDLDHETRFLTGKFDPSKKNGFVLIPMQMSLKKMYLDKRVSKAFQKMYFSAQKAGINLYILSGARNFQAQKNIWEAKFKHSKENNIRDKILKILRYSSMPGTSRHHWGSDIDIVYNPQKPYLTNKSFESGYGLRVYKWLRKNALRFGFCQPYFLGPKNRNPGKYSIGYLEEKWHWSYKPLTIQYLKKYKKYVKNLKPIGFSGYQEGENLYRQFVFNIHPECSNSAK